jgi:hypothetical protein
MPDITVVAVLVLDFLSGENNVSGLRSTRLL